MAFEGMDVDQVTSVAAQLKHQAESITSVISAIDGLISQLESSWKGADATEFQGWWQQQHKPALTAAAQAVDGLGTSAINNANQQQTASAQ